jgi:hypothetical protein
VLLEVFVEKEFRSGAVRSSGALAVCIPRQQR